MTLSDLFCACLDMMEKKEKKPTTYNVELVISGSEEAGLKSILKDGLYEDFEHMAFFSNYQNFKVITFSFDPKRKSWIVYLSTRQTK